MSTSTVRKQRRISARGELAVDTGTIGVIRVPFRAEPSVSLQPTVEPTAAQRLLARVLTGIRDAASSPRMTAAEQRRNDAVYGNDVGGAGDDAGWD